jgi:hypothetical protein
MSANDNGNGYEADSLRATVLAWKAEDFADEKTAEALLVIGHGLIEGLQRGVDNGRKLSAIEGELGSFGLTIANELSAIKAVLELWDSKHAELSLKIAKEFRDQRIALQDVAARVRRMDGERSVTLADVDAVRKSWNDMTVLMATLDERQKQTEREVGLIRHDVVDTKQREIMSAEHAVEVLAAENRKLTVDVATRASIADVELKKTELTLSHGSKESASTWRRDLVRLVVVAVVTLAVGYVAARLGVSAQPLPTAPAAPAAAPH